VNDAIFALLDRIGRAHLCASGRIAVHAHDWDRLGRMTSIDKIQLDHRMSAVRIAFGTSLYASVTADTTTGIDEEFKVSGYCHR
jgi:hypothetical protein